MKRKRTVQIDAQRADAETLTAPATISTDAPTDMGGFTEILSHEPRAVDLSRAPLPLLTVHDSRNLPVGVIENLHLDRGRLRGLVRFGKSDRARELFRDVMDGVLRALSVGYRILDSHNDRKSGAVIVTRWQPIEASLVPVGADPAAGFFRSEKTMTDEALDELEQLDEDNTPEQLSRRERRAQRAADRAEEKRCDEIDDCAQAFAKNRAAGAGKSPARAAIFRIADQAKREGWPVKAVRASMAEVVRTALENMTPEPIPTAHNFRISGGGPQYAPEKLRGFRSEEQAYRAGQWVLASVYGYERAAQWCAEHGIRAASNTIVSKGGALVPEEMSSAIIDLRETFGAARQLCRVVPMSSDTMVIPRRTGGVTAYALGENQEITESDKSWDAVTLVARKWGALSRLPSEYVEDAVIDAASDVASEQAYAFATVEDDALLNGDGTSTYHGIVGVRPKIVDGNHAAGAIDATSGTDTYAEVDGDDLDLLRAALPEFASMNATWVASKRGKALTFDRLQRAAGGNTIETIGGATVQSYLGDRIVVSQKMPTTSGTLDGVAMLLYGDFKLGVTFGDRRGFRMQILTERYAEFDQIGVKGTTRFDIVVHDLGDGTDAGPIVALVGNA